MSFETILADHLKEFEGLRLKAYDDFQPNADITSPDQVKGTLTIGFGHTGPDVHVGQTIDEAHAVRLMKRDMERFIRAVEATVTVPLSDNQKAALVSLCYNIGEGNWRKSTCLKRLNAGDYDGAAEALTWFNKSKGVKMKGLVRRREAERALFLSDMAAEEAPTGTGDGRIEGGEHKPQVKSKTQWMALGGVFTTMMTMWGQARENAPELVEWALPHLPWVFLLIFAGIMLNRYLDSRKGIH